MIGAPEKTKAASASNADRLSDRGEAAAVPCGVRAEDTLPAAVCRNNGKRPRASGMSATTRRV
jgi:hypothetical protein